MPRQTPARRLERKEFPSLPTFRSSPPPGLAHQLIEGRRRWKGTWKSIPFGIYASQSSNRLLPSYTILFNPTQSLDGYRIVSFALLFPSSSLATQRLVVAHALLSPARFRLVLSAGGRTITTNPPRLKQKNSPTTITSHQNHQQHSSPLAHIVRIEQSPHIWLLHQSHGRGLAPRQRPQVKPILSRLRV